MKGGTGEDKERGWRRDMKWWIFKERGERLKMKGDEECGNYKMERGEEVPRRRGKRNRISRVESWEFENRVENKKSITLRLVRSNITHTTLWIHLSLIHPYFSGRQHLQCNLKSPGTGDSSGTNRIEAKENQWRLNVDSASLWLLARTMFWYRRQTNEPHSGVFYVSQLVDTTFKPRPSTSWHQVTWDRENENEALPGQSPKQLRSKLSPLQPCCFLCLERVIERVCDRERVS